MRRREFITVLGGVATAWPRYAEGQKADHPARIGWVALGRQPRIADFRTGMRILGHVEGKTYVLEERYVDGDAKRLPAVVDELLRVPIDLFCVTGRQALRVAAAATRTVPIVFLGPDPVAMGVAESYARPGRNVTGLDVAAPSNGPKQLEFAKAALPTLSRLILLTEVPSEERGVVDPIMAAAPSFGITVIPSPVREANDIDTAFRLAAEAKADAVMVPGTSILPALRPRIIELAQRSRLPVIDYNRVAVEAGALVSYGPDFRDLYRRLAWFVDRILKGARPSELPIELPTKFELVINLKTAKALEIEIPPLIVIRADDVIE